MLVLAPGEPVTSILVGPVDFGRDIFRLHEVPGVGNVLLLTSNEEGFLNTASTVLGLGEEGIRLGLNNLISLSIVSRLRESVNSLVVKRRVFFGLSSGVSLISSPGVFRSSHSAISLDSDVVFTSADSEETIFSPVGTPRVTDEPVSFFSVSVNTISNN